jgi:GatB domain/GatB/GatE catalytic domain
MRNKEEAHDYRYFPDPDLLPLEFSQSYVDELAAHLPELPDARKARFVADYKLPDYDADVLVAERDSADYFEAVVRKPGGAARDAKAAANWVINELFGRLRKDGKDISASPVSAAQLGSILDLMAGGAISGKIAKDVFEIVWSEGGDPAAIVEQRGLKQVTDTGAIEKIVDDIIANNADKVADAKANPKAIGWFVGQIMKASGGKANPQAANELINRKIFEERPRTREEPLQRGEHLFDFYDQSNRDGYEEFRALLNLWLSEVEEAHQAEIISRMRYGGNSAFRATLCELLVHALLKRLGYEVAVHPKVPGSSARPDFVAKDKDGHIICYVEVTTTNRADEDDAHSNREAVIYNAINKANLPAGCVLGYNLVKADKSSPSTRQLVTSIERWAQENAEKAQTEVVIERFTAGSWEFEIELYSDGGSEAIKGAIGAATMPGGRITPAEDVRAALERKSRKYGKLDTPYMIVVADTKNQMFHKNAVTDAMVEAVYGDETGTATTGGEVLRTHANNGFWFSADGCRNQHVSAILLMPDAGIWRLREERWQPLFAANLKANYSIPEGIKVFTRLEAEETKYIRREGKSVADVLAIPTPWPPAG